MSLDAAPQDGDLAGDEPTGDDATTDAGATVDTNTGADGAASDVQSDPSGADQLETEAPAPGTDAN